MRPSAAYSWWTMEPFLLTTKLQIPPQPRRTVRRGRLIDALEREIAHYKLILLSAPAGYGKTTLLSQWALSSRSPVAGLSIDGHDNDLEHFLRGLLAAGRQVQPGIRGGLLGLLDTTSPESGAVLPLPAFINATDEAPGPPAFVVEDHDLGIGSSGIAKEGSDP